ncbi:MAG: aldo/keto reductase [Verrucomicrobia bacterium]|nr:aldo/keto reductase [Verrucomicrobiota bacterium]
MEYRRLGKSGLKVSALSFGAWVTFAQQMSEEEAEACMKAAYDAGCNFFDNAEAYADGQAEEVMGRILKRQGWRRESWIVSSKVFWGGDTVTENGLSRKHVFEACHAALRRLQVDYLDLYFCHRPDPETPLEETVLAMGDLVRQGKVLYWGTSEWTGAQIAEAAQIAREWRVAPPQMEQPQYNLFERHKVEQDYLPLYESLGLGTTIWSPLASGLLTGKYNQGVDSATSTRLQMENYQWLKKVVERSLEKGRGRQVEELGRLAAELGISLPHFALAWCLKNPHVSTVITGASRSAQVVENMKAIEALPKLTDEVMRRTEEILVR